MISNFTSQVNNDINSRWQSEPVSIDKWLLMPALLLIGLGLIMVASASMVVSDQHFHSPFHFLLRQVIYVGVGVGLAVWAYRLPLEFWQKIGPYLFILSLFLLLVVLVPGIGREVNGSRRWLAFGPLSLQVSECVKFAVIIFLAGYLVRRQDEVRTKITGFVKPMLLLALISALLLREPDFGATAVILATALGMMFMARVRLWPFMVLLLIVAAGLAALAVSAPYRLLRLTTFLHPWANQFGSGYQLTQSLIAFGRGGVFGVGLGNSIQKLFYLPEAHTDFLFAVLAEELGLLGELFVITLFSVLVGRSLLIGYRAMQAGRDFSAYLCFGFGIWLGLQAMINIGVNAGVLPTKGLTLPLMSYGGSSMVIDCVVIALLCRISTDSRVQKGSSFDP